MGLPINFGSYTESTTDVEANGLLTAFIADGSTQPISTSVLSGVPVNQPVQFRLKMDASNGYQIQDPRIDFLAEGLHLTTTGNVFTLLSPVADDIVVTSTDGDIVNNVFHPPAVPLLSVPVQGVLVLCLFVSGSLGMRWRELGRSNAPAPWLGMRKRSSRRQSGRARAADLEPVPCLDR